ncbi:MAG: M48 family metalloprotease [Candidatus Korobacteraceae bacterium]|jgi:hypothetical protein
MLRKANYLILVLTFCAGMAYSAVAPTQTTAFEQAIDRITAREAANFKNLQQYSPMVETYIQELRPDKELGLVPEGDHYFLGRATFKGYVRDTSFLNDQQGGSRFAMLHRVHQLPSQRAEFIPLGFAQMAVIDATGFNRQHYDFRYLRREFLGEVRCLVFDVSPKAKSGIGRFVGRIWVEDVDFNIVRANGTFTPGSAKGRYLHFDTWRVNMQPGTWLPSYIYSEESNIHITSMKNTAFKAVTRLWGYNTGRDMSQDAFTKILVEPVDTVKDQSESGQELSPVAAERAWERQAEENVLERMQRADLLAPSGDVEKVLQTVVENLMITNNLVLEPEVRCRVLLTEPIESFTVGHTIVVSRGLLDVLPDEATLAAVLAHELSHIVLAHRLDTRFAFGDRTIFPDDQTLQNVAMARSAEEEQQADKKSLEILQNSPYKDKLVTVGLFMKQLNQSRGALPKLIRAQIGNSLMTAAGPRLASVMTQAPNLDQAKLDQVAALPLGGRIKLDPWTGRVEISKARPVALLNAREKMPFEVTPVFPYLTRFQTSRTATPVPATPTAGAQ